MAFSTSFPPSKIGIPERINCNRMQRLVWLNGSITPLEDAVTSAADHAHLYGDGIFEGIRIYEGKIYKLDEHMERLVHGARYFDYEMHMSVDEIRDTIISVCREAKIQNGYIRVNLTRGTGLGLDPKHIDRTPNLMVMVTTLNLYPAEAYETGLKVVTTPVRIFAPDALDPRIKCIGRYASNIMAKHYANRQGAGEGLMLNAAGEVAECSADNIFVIHKRAICTPDASSGILKGITRDTVIDLAREAGYEVKESRMTIFDIMSADEAFLTGTAAEVIPMISLDDRPIGSGKPGEVTKHIMEIFKESTKEGTPFN